jgi:parvulin-like peptidyl-prolyl isomerase
MKRFLLSVLLVAILLNSCTMLNDRDIASVGNKKISVDELYRYMPKANFDALTSEEKAEKIESICKDYMARYYLEEEGVFDSGDVYWEIQTYKIRELANGAYQKLIIDKIINPASLKELYEKMRYDLNVSHILIGFNNEKNLNERDRESALTLVNTIADSVNGTNFEHFAIKYSDDGSVGRNNGTLGWAKAGHWVEPFENTAYTLKPGEISKPIETDFGFHIIKLNERREMNLEPYDQIEEELVDIAFDAWRYKFIKREKEVLDSLKTEYVISINDSLLNDFLERFNRLSKNVFYSEQFTAFDIMDIFDDTLSVGSFGKDPIDKEWIIQYLKLISIKVPPRFTTSDSFWGFIDQSSLGAMFYNTALNHKLDKSEEFRKTFNVFLAKKSSGLFDKLYVYEQINPRGIQLKEFYDQYKDSLYTIEARVQVKEILLEDSLEAVGILEKIKKGADISALATQYSKRNIGKKSEGLIPAFKRTQYGDMSETAFEIQDGEIAGPFKLGEYYSVIQRVNYIPEEHRPYDQIKYRIVTDYRNIHMAEKRSEQDAMLRNKYKVRINPSFQK